MAKPSWNLVELSFETSLNTLNTLEILQPESNLTPYRQFYPVAQCIDLGQAGWKIRAMYCLWPRNVSNCVSTVHSCNVWMYECVNLSNVSASTHNVSMRNVLSVSRKFPILELIWCNVCDNAAHPGTWSWSSSIKLVMLRDFRTLDPWGEQSWLRSVERWCCVVVVNCGGLL